MRAAALKKNVEHGKVQNETIRSVALRQVVEMQALTEGKSKLTHEAPNYSRSSHHYVSNLQLSLISFYRLLLRITLTICRLSMCWEGMGVPATSVKI